MLIVFVLGKYMLIIFGFSALFYIYIYIYIYINFKCIQNVIFDPYRIYNLDKIYFIHNIFF